MKAISLLIVVVAAGCGMKGDYSETTAEYNIPREMKADSTAASATSAESAMTAATGDAAAVERKIIYTAEVDLVVEDFGPLPEKIDRLVQQFDAYVARSNVSGMPGQPRRGVWTVRVPVSRYGEFLAAARQLGEVKSVRSDSKDVTAEFFDVDARIRNKQREEERLIKLLDDVTGKLQDILEVERELSRVRGEIEQFQGRMRVLKDLTAMTTVEIRVEEIRNYVPESPEAPTLWNAGSASVRRFDRQSRLGGPGILDHLGRCPALVGCSYRRGFGGTRLETPSPAAADIVARNWKPARLAGMLVSFPVRRQK
jgi:hypothetical protein